MGGDEDYVRVPRALAGHLLILAENYGSRYAEELEKIMHPKDQENDMSDPPEPESVVTDEMVDEVIDSMPQNLRSRTIVRAVLEAVERLGWLDGALVHSALMDELERMGADPDLCWDEALGVIDERLAMAERLLRRATGTTSIGVRYLALYELTAAEAEYLHSLAGEGE